ncbi:MULTISPECIES: NADH-dependent flavin oxidoreductase [Acinetobacter]|uniref:NADH-dependent flavin oxidoreductase n=1 Tax=Acinetobacter TaxID=469 RepID=UPI00039F93FE|nr:MULTISPECIES: NADH-dependent flavin oxidoreductase [Acinetobacter]UUM26035.1 NADH-dependent flavin oxidoreductase [Acinetobacter colistiniresistens]
MVVCSVNSKLFQSFQLTADLNLRNRIVMAPMTTWSANRDSTISAQELEYMRKRVKDVGLVITGCTHVQESGIGFTREFAGFDDRFIPSLTQLAQAAKSGGAPAILQVFHAGMKAIPNLIPHADIVSASSLAITSGPFKTEQLSSRALSHDEVLQLIHDFGEATRRAIDAGFDGIELHGAHGFIIQNFFSPLYNQRDDAWGGSLEKRMAFPLAVVAEVQRVIQQHAQRPFALGYRISVEEYEDNALSIADSLALIDQLIAADIDYLHVSLVDVLHSMPKHDLQQQLSIHHVLKRVADRIPVIAAGLLRTPQQAEQALGLGLPLIAIGKALVMNPNWVALAQHGQFDNITLELNPIDVPELSIPDLLWQEIQEREGWFKLRRTETI